MARYGNERQWIWIIARIRFRVCVNVCACAPFSPLLTVTSKKLASACLHYHAIRICLTGNNEVVLCHFFWSMARRSGFDWWNEMVNGMAFEYSQYPVINTYYMDVGIMRGSTMFGVMQMLGLLYPSCVVLFTHVTGAASMAERHTRKWNCVSTARKMINRMVLSILIYILLRSASLYKNVFCIVRAGEQRARYSNQIK